MTDCTISSIDFLSIRQKDLSYEEFLINIHVQQLVECNDFILGVITLASITDKACYHETNSHGHRKNSFGQSILVPIIQVDDNNWLSKRCNELVINFINCCLIKQTGMIMTQSLSMRIVFQQNWSMNNMTEMIMSQAFSMRIDFHSENRMSF